MTPSPPLRPDTPPPIVADWLIEREATVHDVLRLYAQDGIGKEALAEWCRMVEPEKECFKVAVPWGSEAITRWQALGMYGLVPFRQADGIQTGWAITGPSAGVGAAVADIRTSTDESVYKAMRITLKRRVLRLFDDVELTTTCRLADHDRERDPLLATIERQLGFLRSNGIRLEYSFEAWRDERNCCHYFRQTLTPEQALLPPEEGPPWRLGLDMGRAEAYGRYVPLTRPDAPTTPLASPR